MKEINYQQFEEFDFKLEIPKDLLQNIITESDCKPYKFSNLDNDFVFVYNKILKWLLINDPVDTTRIKLSYETGYIEGYSLIQKNYADKYVIGSKEISINLKKLYQKYKIISETNYHIFNPVSTMWYGEAGGIKRRIEELYLTYPHDLDWINEFSKGVRLIDENTIKNYWSEYCDIIKDLDTPEIYEKFEKRFYLNDEEHSPLIILGNGGVDKYTPCRKWLATVLRNMKSKIDTSYFNYGNYTKKAFGVDIIKKK